MSCLAFCGIIAEHDLTPGRCSCCWLPSCFIPPGLLHILNKVLFLLAACTYYDAELPRGHRKGLFGGRSLGRTNTKCKLFCSVSRNRCWGFSWKQQSCSLYFSAMYCRKYIPQYEPCLSMCWISVAATNQSWRIQACPWYGFWTADVGCSGGTKTFVFNWTGRFLRPTGCCLWTRSTSWTREHSTSEWDGWGRTVTFSAPSDLPAGSARSCSGKHGTAWFWLQCHCTESLLVVSRGRRLMSLAILVTPQSLCDWSLPEGAELSSRQQTRADD